MYCPRCGKSMGEGYAYCPSCGEKIDNGNPIEEYVDDGNNYNTGLYKVAVAFMVITVVFWVGLACALPFATIVGPNGSSQIDEQGKIVLAIILCAPLLWDIPALIYLLVSMRKNKPVKTWFKILVFIFNNPISAIMLLLSADQYAE